MRLVHLRDPIATRTGCSLVRARALASGAANMTEFAGGPTECSIAMPFTSSPRYRRFRLCGELCFIHCGRSREGDGRPYRQALAVVRRPKGILDGSGPELTNHARTALLGIEACCRGPQPTAPGP